MLHTLPNIPLIMLNSFACREKVLKWDGWGYKDSGFRFNKNNVAEFTGKTWSRQPAPSQGKEGSGQLTILDLGLLTVQL